MTIIESCRASDEEEEAPIHAPESPVAEDNLFGLTLPQEVSAAPEVGHPDQFMHGCTASVCHVHGSKAWLLHWHLQQHEAVYPTKKGRCRSICTHVKNATCWSSNITRGCREKAASHSCQQVALADTKICTAMSCMATAIVNTNKSNISILGSERGSSLLEQSCSQQEMTTDKLLHYIW
jgi:hypothetical protein